MNREPLAVNVSTYIDRLPSENPAVTVGAYDALANALLNVIALLVASAATETLPPGSGYRPSRSRPLH